MQCIVQSCGIWRVKGPLSWVFGCRWFFPSLSTSEGVIVLARGCMVRSGGRGTELDHGVQEI